MTSGTTGETGPQRPENPSPALGITDRKQQVNIEKETAIQ